MSPKTASVASTLPGFPRVSGDEPNLRQVLEECRLFSPRERG